MEITIRPADGFNAEVTMGDGAMVVSEEDAISLMNNAKGAGYSIRVEFNAQGFTLNGNIQNAALDLAGLSSFQAAKQGSGGYIEF